MLNILLPVLGDVVATVLQNKQNIAQEADTSPEIVERVGGVLQNYLTKDERLLQQASERFEAARMHDMATQTTGEPIVNIARGLVRPCITFTAMGWYVYARVQGVPLQAEDYAIIGGILAFWFGFRPFEKIRHKR